jgi:Holliday junction resolvase RusA-like endonuclease
MIIIEYRAEPIAKSAPQFAVKGKRAHAYIPERQLRYHEGLRYAAQKQMEGKFLLLGPITLDLTVYLFPPGYLTKLKRRRAIAGLEYPTTRPDLSNYIKMVEDALIKVVFLDDNQVVSLMARKRYGEIPGIRVEIEEVRDDNVQFT